MINSYTYQKSSIIINTGVYLTTMHASKGLEWQVVIIPSIEETVIPQKKANTTEAMEEERRVLYVAMTRAKQYLYVLAKSNETENFRESRFFDEIKRKENKK